jgi:hypothetical protein
MLNLTVDDYTKLADTATRRIDEELRLYGMHAELPPITPGQAREILRVAHELQLVTPAHREILRLHQGRILVADDDGKLVDRTDQLAAHIRPKESTPVAPVPAVVDPAPTKAVASAPRKSRRHWNPAELEPTVIAALQQMAANGTMPSISTWNVDRPHGLPNAMNITRRLSLTWNQLAAKAGLTATPPRGRPAKEEDAVEPAPVFRQTPHRTPGRPGQTEDLAKLVDTVNDHAAVGVHVDGNSVQQLSEKARATLGAEHIVVTSYRGN